MLSPLLAGELEGVRAISRLRSENPRLTTNLRPDCSCPMNRALATTSSGDKSASTPLIRGAGGLALSVQLRNSYIVSIYCILIGFYVPFVLSLFHEKHLLCHMNRPVSKIS